MRLVCVGNTIIDVTVAVGAFPEHGGDVLAHSGALHAGGSGFNVMCAASRLGVTSVYAGMHGTGPFGDTARTAMAREGIEPAQEPDTAGDTGWDIAITDATAERTFITVVGAESRLTSEHISLVTVDPGDAVYISGYSLLAEPNRTSICDWLVTLPSDVVVVTDPGPLVADIPNEVLTTVLARTTWLSANEREATAMSVARPAAMSGETGPLGTASHIASRIATLLTANSGGVILRLGAAGCIVAEPGREVQAVPGITVDAIDTNGAGDTHVGAFIASLLAGLDPIASAQRANAAAAHSVTRAGPATAPTTRELELLLGA